MHLEVIVSQLVERLLPTPEVRGFETSHWQTFIKTFVYCQQY